MNEHVVINQDRTVIVPESQRKIGVQYDHNVKTITFDCPRYPEENPAIDMSTMHIYINYLLADKTIGASAATNVVIDETDPTIMHFDWEIKKAVTYVKGNLFSLICIKQVDDEGNDIYHWNTDLFQKFFVGEGMECVEEIEDENTDLITLLLSRMDAVEELANPITMQQYVADYLNADPDLHQSVIDEVNKYMAEQGFGSDKHMKSYVADYIDEHPILFVVGPEKPGVSCIWFDTGEGSTGNNETLKLTSDSLADSVYVTLDETGETITELDVEYNVNPSEIKEGVYLTDATTKQDYKLSVNDSHLIIEELDE